MYQSLAVLFFMAAAIFAPAARAVTINWKPVDSPGNSADPVSGRGAVAYSYNIDAYDVTNNQYVEFLNAKDPTGADMLGLFSTSMGGIGDSKGIGYTAGNSDGSKYAVQGSADNLPVRDVTLFDAMRFANWLNNGQGSGDTETGAYTLLGGTPTPSNVFTLARNPDATIFIPSIDEWYKAAYFNPGTNSYYAFATSSNTVPTAATPTPVPNSANYNDVLDELTNVGAYSGTVSPYGLYDMVGNAGQWNDTDLGGDEWNLSGGLPGYNVGDLNKNRHLLELGTAQQNDIGFRVAAVAGVPEPSTFVLGSLAAAGLCAIGWRRRKR